MGNIIDITTQLKDLNFLRRNCDLITQRILPEIPNCYGYPKECSDCELLKVNGTAQKTYTERYIENKLKRRLNN